MIISCETDMRQFGARCLGLCHWRGRRRQQEDSSYTVTTWGWPRWMSGEGGDMFWGKLAEFDVKKSISSKCLIKNSFIKMSGQKVTTQLKKYTFIRGFSKFVWTFLTEGDTEEWGGQEKGICQGAQSRRLTQNMLWGERVRRWPLSHLDTDPAWPGADRTELGEREKSVIRFEKFLKTFHLNIKWPGLCCDCD